MDFGISPNTETLFVNGSFVESSLIKIYNGEKYVSVSLYGINESRRRFVDFLYFVTHRIVFLTCSPRRIFPESLSWPFDTAASVVFLLTCGFFPLLLLLIRKLFGLPKEQLSLLVIRIGLSQSGPQPQATKCVR